MHAHMIAIGIGCDRNTPLANLQTALQLALTQAQVLHRQIALFASIDAKSDETGILQLAQLYGVPLHFYSAQELAQIAVPNPSATVLRYMGTPSVSEAAAILAARGRAENLLVEKFKYCGADGKNATISIARIQNESTHE